MDGFPILYLVLLFPRRSPTGAHRRLCRSEEGALRYSIEYFVLASFSSKTFAYILKPRGTRNLQRYLLKSKLTDLLLHRNAEGLSQQAQSCLNYRKRRGITARPHNDNSTSSCASGQLERQVLKSVPGPHLSVPLAASTMRRSRGAGLALFKAHNTA
jgi:hypothetical protein